MVGFSIEAGMPHILSKSEQHSFPAPILSLYSSVPLARTDMAINGFRNKPFGPGGGTRRLHPSPAARAAGTCSPTVAGLRRGRNRIDEGVKVFLLLGMVPPLSGQKHSCQRQQCSGCCRRV